jgi:MtN3 and saliva related transmembrane protein
MGARKVGAHWGECMGFWVESVGSVAAVCTTLCWVPQTVKIIREKRTDGISLITQGLFTFGVFLWAAYGLLIGRWPLILANIVTLALSVAILLLKLRYR